MTKVTLKSGIPALISSLDDKTLDAVEEVAERIVEGAQERVPVDSGELRDAIHVESDRERKEVRVVAGDNDAFYGHLVEYGTTHTPARPFLTPAFEVEKPKLGEVVGKQIEGAL
jgi:HK97 gp10 family phage protein